MTSVLDRLDTLLSGLDDQQTAELDRLIDTELQHPWLPTPGPQLEAFLSEADLLLYGGAAGGGKTDLICGLALIEHERTVVFRRQANDLEGFWERLGQICPNPVHKDSNKKKMRTADGRLIECGHLDAPESEQGWQGRPHDLICFDEGAQLPAAKVKFVLGWNRSASGKRCRAVIASNPPIGGEGAWLIEWFAPWLDPLFPNPAKPGELRWAVTIGDKSEIKTVWADGPEPIILDEKTYEPLSRTFIPSKLNDNPYLRDTNYRAQLSSMPEPLRSQLLEGDFLAGKTDHEWQVIPSAWVDAAQARWKPEKPERVRMTTLGVDVAQGGPDKTVLAPLYGVWFDKLSVHKGIDTKDGPAVAGLVVTTMRDSCQVNIDMTGGWGISARDQLTANGIRCKGIVFSSGSDERAANGAFGFLNMRSELWWRFREALEPFKGDNIALPPGAALKAQLTAPQWKLRGDKVIIESKDDIRERLGSSTDEADAVVMAWHDRGAMLFYREFVEGGQGSHEREYDPLSY